VRQYLETIQRIDERGRCMGVDFYISDKREGQYDSHGYSYLKAREIMKDIENKPIGLELEVNEEVLEDGS